MKKTLISLLVVTLVAASCALMPDQQVSKRKNVVQWQNLCKNKGGVKDNYWFDGHFYLACKKDGVATRIN